MKHGGKNVIPKPSRAFWSVPQVISFLGDDQCLVNVCLCSASGLLEFVRNFTFSWGRRRKALAHDSYLNRFFLSFVLHYVLQLYVSLAPRFLRCTECWVFWTDWLVFNCREQKKIGTMNFCASFSGQTRRLKTQPSPSRFFPNLQTMIPFFHVVTLRQFSHSVLCYLL